MNLCLYTHVGLVQLYSITFVFNLNLKQMYKLRDNETFYDLRQI